MGTIQLRATTIPTIGGWVTPSVEAVVGRDDLDELDSDLEPLGLRAEVAVQLRRRFGRFVWYRAEVRGRQLGELSPTAVGRLTGDSRIGELAIQGDLLYAVQSTPMGTAAGSRLRIRGDYTFLRTDRLSLTAGLGLFSSSLNLETVPDEVDPLVTSDSLRQHPLSTPYRLTARYRAFADQIATARVEVRNDSPTGPVDRIDGELSWRGLLEIWPLDGPIANLAYRPSLRLADGLRPADTWRHDLGLSLAWRLGAITLAAHGDVYLPSTGGAASSFRLIARWDLGARGRAGVDLLPSETPLADFALERSWTR